jgi:hypothetical protein
MRFIRIVAIGLSSAVLLVPGAGIASGAAAPSSAPAAMSRQDAGAYYLDWGCFANHSTVDVLSSFDGKSARTLLQPAYKATARRAAVVYRQAAAALASPPQPWPANVVNPVADVVKGIRTAGAGMTAIVKATTAKQVQAGLREFQSSATPSSGVVRQRLGLPPADGKDNGCTGRGQRPQ